MLWCEQCRFGADATRRVRSLGAGSVVLLQLGIACFREQRRIRAGITRGLRSVGVGDAGLL